MVPFIVLFHPLRNQIIFKFFKGGVFSLGRGACCCGGIVVVVLGFFFEFGCGFFGLVLVLSGFFSLLLDTDV